MIRPVESLDELQVGQRWEFGRVRMEEEAIIAFGRQWDRQPFHIDPEAAKDSIYGGLIASGLHTQVACFSVILDSQLWSKASLGGAGMDVRWPTAVRPGDEIDVAGEVTEIIPSRSRPDRGIAKIRYTGTRVADGATVLELLATQFVRR